jgi:hypothetical protein
MLVEYEAGTLLLEFMDARSGKLVWRGVAKGSVDPKSSPERRDENVKEAVRKLLKKFPP